METLTIKDSLIFLNEFNNTKKIALANLQQAMRLNVNNVKTIVGYNFIKVINYKDLEHWENKNESQTLIALFDKIEHMVNDIGCPNSVLPMLKAILKGTKKIKYPSLKTSAVCHFRWNWRFYTLTPNELKIIEKLLN